MIIICKSTTQNGEPSGHNLRNYLESFIMLEGVVGKCENEALGSVKLSETISIWSQRISLETYGDKCLFELSGNAIQGPDILTSRSN